MRGTEDLIFDEAAALSSCIMEIVLSKYPNVLEERASLSRAQWHVYNVFIFTISIFMVFLFVA